ncbi:serine hydrolase [Pontibacter diazotrophicus]|nr:serine hydrolase [Pontibacter diazotrophicus]
MGLASQAHIPDGGSLQAEKHNYNDIAYNLLSEIMGRVTGTPYDDIVELELPQPIKLGLHYSSVRLEGGFGEVELRKSVAINGRKLASLPDVTNPERVEAIRLYTYARSQN